MTPFDAIAEADRRWSGGAVRHGKTDLWPVLRIRIAAVLEAGQFSSEESMKSAAGSLIAALRAIPRIPFSFLSRRDWVAITDSIEAKPVDGGVYIDKILHPIATRLGRKLRIVCEEGLKPGCAQRYVYGAAVPLEALKLFVEALSWGWYRFRKIPFFALGAEELATSENERYLKRFTAYRTGWRFYFWLIRAKHLLVNCYYGLGHQAAIAAAHDLGMFVDEIQHGLISPSHLSYNAGAPLDPYALPNRLLAFGESSLSSNYQGSPSAIELIGSWYLNTMRSAVSSVRDPRISDLRSRYDRIVAVSGQWSVQDDLVSFLRVAALLDKRIAYIYIPRSMEGIDSGRFTGNLFLSNGEMDVYGYIRECHVHVTVYSTCALEALALGKPGVLIDLGGLATQYLKPILEDSPYSRYVMDPAGLVAAIRKAPMDSEGAERIGARYYAPFDPDRLEAVIKT